MLLIWWNQRDKQAPDWGVDVPGWTSLCPSLFGFDGLPSTDHHGAGTWPAGYEGCSPWVIMGQAHGQLAARRWTSAGDGALLGIGQPQLQSFLQPGPFLCLQALHWLPYSACYLAWSYARGVCMLSCVFRSSEMPDSWLIQEAEWNFFFFFLSPKYLKSFCGAQINFGTLSIFFPLWLGFHRNNGLIHDILALLARLQALLQGIGELK